MGIVIGRTLLTKKGVMRSQTDGSGIVSSVVNCPQNMRVQLRVSLSGFGWALDASICSHQALQVQDESTRCKKRPQISQDIVFISCPVPPRK